MKTLSALLAASLLAASLVPAAAEEVDVSRLTPIWGTAPAAAPTTTPVVEGRQTVPVVSAASTHPTAPLSTAERFIIDHNAAEGD